MRMNRLRSESLRAVVMADDATIRWNEQTLNSNEDPGLVRSSFPIPRDVSYFFYEMKILYGGEDLLFGLATFDSDGKRRNDYCYSFANKNGTVKSPILPSTKHFPYQVGDVITCGVSFLGLSVEPFVFFARNGEMLEPYLPWKATSNSLDHFAFIQGSSSGTTVIVSFDEPFICDWGERLNEIELERKEQRLSTVSWNHDLICEKLVKDFLYHHGYIETLRAMDDESEVPEEDATTVHDIDMKDANNGSIKNHQPTTTNGHSHNGNVKKSSNGGNNQQHNGHHLVHPSGDRLDGIIMEEEDEVDKDLAFARQRRHIRSLVLEGRLVEATTIVAEKWPAIMDTLVGLNLRVQCLVELILLGEYQGAVQHARTQIWPYIAGGENASQESYEIAVQALGLFAHPDPKSYLASSRLALFAPDRRRSVADSLNRALLFHPNPPKAPALEKILVKYAELASVAREKAGLYGAEFKFQ
jgi:hypothetical protein